jgi:hypothetical protein
MHKLLLSLRELDHSLGILLSKKSVGGLANLPQSNLPLARKAINSLAMRHLRYSPRHGCLEFRCEDAPTANRLASLLSNFFESDVRRRGKAYCVRLRLVEQSHRAFSLLGAGEKTRKAEKVGRQLEEITRREIRLARLC